MNFCRFCLFCFGVADVSLTAYSFLNAKEFIEAAANVPNVVTVVLITLKTCVTFWHRKDIWDIIQELRAVFTTQLESKAKHNMKKYIVGYLLLIKTYAAILLALILPVASPAIMFVIKGEMKFTINYWYPFDAFTVWTFPLAILWTNFIAYTILGFLLAADSLLYALITVIAMQLDNLSIDLMNIKKIVRHERMETLKIIIKRHDKLMELCDKLQQIYSITFLVSFTISSLVLCFVVFMLSTANDLAAYTFYVPYLCLVTGQVLLLCSFGQKIIDSSLAVAEGAYNSGWEGIADLILKKELALMMLRAQRCKKLSAMGFVDMNLESFASVKLSIINVLHN